MQSTHSSAIFSITRWLPLHLQHGEDYGQSLRIRIFLLLILMCITPLALLLPFIYSLLPGDFSTYWQPALILTLIVVAQSVNLAWFLKSGDIDLCGFVYSLIIYALVSAAVILTGGWTSPVCKLLLAVPLITSLVTSRFIGLMMSLAAPVLYSILFLLAQMHYELPQYVPADYIDWAHIGLWFTALFFLVGSLLLFDFSTDDLSKVIQKERQLWQADLDLDELTHTLSPEKLHEVATKFLALRAEQNKDSDTGLIYIQIVKLKDLNNDFGLEAGDQLLKMLADLLRDLSSYSQCHLSRYHADTYVLFVPETNSSEFISLINKITLGLMQPQVLTGGVRIRPHCPLGAALSSQRNITLDHLLNSARAHMASSSQESSTNKKILYIRPEINT